MKKLSARARQAGIHRKSGPKKVKGLLLRRKQNRTATEHRRITNGRPQKWNRNKTFRYICERVSAGNLATEVTKELGLGYPTLMGWIALDDTGEFSKRWSEAKTAQSHALAARALAITQGRDGRSKAVRKAKKELKKTDSRWREKARQLDSVRVQRNRLELDGIKWYTRVINPKEFGEKVDVTSDGQQLPAAQSLTVKFVEAKEGK